MFIPRLKMQVDERRFYSFSIVTPIAEQQIIEMVSRALC